MGARNLGQLSKLKSENKKENIKEKGPEKKMEVGHSRSLKKRGSRGRCESV